MHVDNPSSRKIFPNIISDNVTLSQLLSKESYFNKQKWEGSLERKAFWIASNNGLHGVTKESATTLSTKQQQQPELKGHDLKIFKENWRFMVLVCFIIILFKYVLYLKLNSWSKTNYYDQCGKFYFPLGK